MRSILIVFLTIILFFAGCISPNSFLFSQNNSSENAPLFLPSNEFPKNFNIPPSDASASAVFCTDGSRIENESCFKSAFASCSKTIGYFWSMENGSSLVLESFGRDTRSGNCLLQLTPGDEESKYLGMAAYCSIPPTLREGKENGYFFDVENVNSITCTGTLMGYFVQTPD